MRVVKRDSTERPRGGARLRRVLGRVGLLLPAALLLVNVAVVLQSVRAMGGLEVLAHRSDFMPTLTAASIINDGHAADLFDLGTQRRAQAALLAGQAEAGPGELLPYNHLPFEAMAIAPLLLAGLSKGTIFALWSTVNVVAFLASIWLLRRVSPVPGAAGVMLVLAACSYVPVLRAFVLGQNTPLVLLGLCATYAARRDGRDWLAGGALVLLALKPQLLPVMVVLLLVQRGWRTLAAFGGVFGGLCLVVMPLFGVGWPLRFVRVLSEILNWENRLAVDPLIMPSWRGLAANLVGAPLPNLVMPSFLLLSLLSIVLLVRACHRGGRAGRLSPVHDLQWALGATVSLVTAIHLNPHDLTLILFPAWIVASCALVATPRRRGATSWLWVLWLGYAAGILPAFPFVLLNVTLMGAALVLLAREIDGFAPGALASRASHSPAVQAGSGRR